jgi:hypothetical protein
MRTAGRALASSSRKTDRRDWLRAHANGVDQIRAASPRFRSRTARFLGRRSVRRPHGGGCESVAVFEDPDTNEPTLYSVSYLEKLCMDTHRQSWRARTVRAIEMVLGQATWRN